MAAVPVWVWLPGSDSPVQAGELVAADSGARFRYSPDYLASGQALPLDPVELRITRSKSGVSIAGADGLAGVMRDAKPAGYGADRLNAQAGEDLSPLQLLERGVPDGVGAIEVCTDIERKLAWKPRQLDELKALMQELDAEAPASRAMRKLNEDLDTSAGGERPKTTLAHEGRQWLAKMQSRGDRPAMPAREYVAMRLASMAGIDAAPVMLHTVESHQVLLVERFDRLGDPMKPQRRFYASAHTAMRLTPATTKGDRQRSYLNLGDRLRIWAKGRDDLQDQLAELWRRMAFNAIVGNVDDHPLNHGFVHDGSARTPWGWHLSRAFDITPALNRPLDPIGEGPALSMATGVDGRATTSVERLVQGAGHFGVTDDDARQWLQKTAQLVATQWEPMLRNAAGPAMPDAARLDTLIGEARVAFAYGEWLAGLP